MVCKHRNKGFKDKWIIGKLERQVNLIRTTLLISFYKLVYHPPTFAHTHIYIYI